MYKLYLFDDLESISKEFIDRCMTVLSEERRQKALRYKFEIDRKISVISYLLLLYALCENYNIKNPEISYGKYGKPYLSKYPDIHFSISHCPAGCICAVSDNEIGVDIQDIRPFSWEIAKRVCSREEIKLLANSKEKEYIFTKMWAVKESYSKMTGNGILNTEFIDTACLNTEIDTFDKSDYVIAISHTIGGKNEY